MSLAISKRLKAGFKKSIIFFAMILVTLNGMLPSFSTPVQAAEIDITEAIEQPNVSKDIDGEESKEIPKGEDFNYNVIVELPESVSGYESIEILDDLDQHLAVQGTAVLIDEEENDTYKVVVDGQKISLGLTMEELEELAGKEVKLQITTQVKEDAATADEIENVAQIVINDDLIMETNPAVVTPIEMVKEKPDSEAKQQSESQEKSESQEESKSVDDVAKAKETDSEASTEKTNTKSKASVTNTETGFNFNTTDTYISVTSYNGKPGTWLLQIDGHNPSAGVKAEIHLPSVAGFDSIAMSKDGTEIYGIEANKNSFIYKITEDGNATKQTLNMPSELTTFTPQGAGAIDPITGHYALFVRDVTKKQSRIILIDPNTGNVVDSSINPNNRLNLRDNVFDDKGNMYYIDATNEEWVRYDRDTGKETVFGRVGNIPLTTPGHGAGLSYLPSNELLIAFTQGDLFASDPKDNIAKNLVKIPNINFLTDAASAVFPNFYTELNVDKFANGSKETSSVNRNDIIEYKIVVSNTGNLPADNAILTDKIPAGTEYVANSTKLNGKAVADIDGQSPLEKGLKIKSPAENASEGVILVGEENAATITFQVKVKDDTAPGSEILNQASMTSSEPDEVKSNEVISKIEESIDPPDACAAPVALINGSFEEPPFSPDDPRLTKRTGWFDAPQAAVPGWKTTDRSGLFEIMNKSLGDEIPPGHPYENLKVTPAHGQQFAELNSREAAQLYQDVDTTPGQTIYWRLAHKGRDGQDTMALKIDSATVDPKNLKTIETMTSGKEAWKYYSGAYVVPVGQTKTRFGFEAVSSATGSNAAGNFLDDIFLGTEPCVTAEKMVSPEGDVFAGDELTYEMTVKNSGGDVAANTIIEDAIPEGTEYVPGSMKILNGPKKGSLTDADDDDAGHYTNEKVTFKLGDLANTTELPDGITVQFKVKALSSHAGKTVANKAQVKYKDLLKNEEKEIETNETKTPIKYKDPVLESEKSAKLHEKADGNPDKDHPESGDTLLYTIQTRNTIENSPVKNLVISDTIPGGLEYVPGTLTVDGKKVSDEKDDDQGEFVDNKVTGKFGDVTDTEWHTITFKVKVKEGQAGKTIKNTATVTGDNLDKPDKPETSIVVYPLDPPSGVCGPTVSLINGSFEGGPARGSANNEPYMFLESEVPGWNTTDDSQGVKIIEIWDYKQGYPAGVVNLYPAPPDGNRYAELNAYDNGLLYQDVKTTPGQTIYWRLSHMGRAGVDTMQLRIGPVTNNPYDTPVIEQMSDGNTKWGNYTGTYTVPAGQTMTRFGFEAVSTASGNLGAGNFLDDIFLGTEACITAEKSVSPEGDVFPGDELTYEVTVKNAGGDVASNTVIEDAIPEGTEYVPGSMKILSGPKKGDVTDEKDSDAGHYTDGKVTFNIGDLPNTNDLPDGVTVQFKVKALSDHAGKDVINKAQVKHKNLLTGKDEETETNETKTPIKYKDPVLKSEKSATIKEKGEGNTDKDNPEVGDTLLYTIKTQNTNKDSLVKNLVISDEIPEGLEYVAGSLKVDDESVTDAKDDDNGHAVDGKISGQFGDIKGTDWHTLTFEVKVKAGQAGMDIKNIATVKGDNIDKPDEPEEEVKIYPREPKLESEKSATNAEKGKEKFEVGDTIVYTIKTRNKVSDSLVSNLTIEDTLPAGLELIADSLKASHGGTVEENNGVITAKFGEVTDTEWRTVTFEAKIKSGQSGKDIKNTAKVTVDEIEEPEEPTTTVKVDPKEPKLESEKSAKLEAKADGNTDKDNPEVGDTLLYTIKTKNTIADSLVKNLVISDKIPEGLEYVASSLKVNGTSVTDAKDDDNGYAVNGEIAGQFGDIEDTEWHTLEFLVKVKEGQAGADIKNIATVKGENIDKPDEPEEEVKIYPREPKLESEKSATNAEKGKEKFEVGDTIVYTIKTRNKVSDSLVSNLTIEDTLPAGLELIADSLKASHGGTVEEKDGVITASFGDVKDTEWRTVTFEAKIKSGQSGKDIKNTAKVTVDEIEEPEEPTTTVKVDPKEPKLDSKKSSKLEKKAEGNTDAKNPEVGDTIRYTITTKNTIEDSLVKNLVITDTIPSGLSYVPDSLEVDGEKVTDAKDDDAGHVVDGKVTGNFGEVTDTKEHTVSFLVTVDKGQSGKDIKNIAVVGGENTGDPDEPEEEVKIYPREPKLESKKSSKLEKKAEGNTDAKNPEVGDTIRYTITTKNTIEDSLVENLVITDTIPSGLSYVAGSLEVDGESVTDAKDDDAGHVVDGKVTGNFGNVTDTKAHTVSFLVTVDKGQSGKDIKNIAVVGGENTGDPDEPEEEVKIYPREPKLDSKKSSKLEKKAEGNTDAKNPEVGDTIRYTITTNNTIEDSLVKDLVITDTIPAGLSYVAGSLEVDGEKVTDAKDDDAGHVVDVKVTGNFGDVTDTKAHTVSFLVTVDKGQSGKDIKNIAVVGGENTGDPDEPEEEVKIYPREPKLDSKKSSKLEKKAEGNTDAKNPEVGDTIRYTITTNNTIEDSLVKNLVITDMIPAGLSYVAGSLEVDGKKVTDAKDDDAGHVVDGKVTGTFGDVTDTKEHTVTFLVTVDKGQSGKDIKNIAVVGGENTEDPDEPEEEVKIYPREPKLDSKKSSKLEKKAEGNTDAKNPEVGDTIRYTITTKNTIEDSLVKNLVITDTIPAGLSYVAGSLEVEGESVTDAKDDDAGHVVDGKVTGNFGDVTDTKDHTVSFLVTIDKGQSGKDIKNIAVVGGENTEDPDEPEEEVKIYPREPKLDSKKSSKLEKKAEGNTDAKNPEVGDTIRYTITTKNTIEDSLVENLVITDTIPSGLSYVPGSLEVDGEQVTDAKDDDAGHVVDGKVTGNFGDVTDTKAHTVSFLVTVDKGQSGKDIKNIAIVGGENTGDPDEPEEEVKIYPREPKLDSKKSSKLEKKAEGNTDAKNPEVGDTIRYTITTKNTIEDSLIEKLVITDTIPSGLSYVPGSLEVDGNKVTDAKDDDAGHVVDVKVTVSFGDVTDTKEHTVSFLVTVDKGQSGKDIKNIAVVGGENTGDPDEPEEEVKIYPREPKLDSKKSSKLEKKAEGNTDAKNPEVGDTIRYTITTKNTIEDSLVEKLVITDTIPSGLSYVAGSLEVDGQSVTDAKDDDAGHVVDGKVTGNFGDVTDTKAHTVSFLVTVDKGQSGKDIKNIAVVGGENTGDPDEPEEEVKIYPREPKLESEKSATNAEKGKEKFEVGDTIVYTIKTRNKVSDSLVQNLTITDKLPAGLEYVADSLKVSHEGTGNFKGGTITANFGDVKDTEWRTVTFQAKIKSGQSGKELKNIAVVDGDNIDKPDEPEEKVTVDPKDPTLQSEKSAKLEAKADGNKDKDNPEVGDTLLYTIKTKNKIEDSLVKNLVISDEIPEGLEYVAGSLKVDGQSVTDAKDDDKGYAVDGKIVGQFGNIKDTNWHTVEFLVKVKTGQSGKDIKNIATVDGDNIDKPDKPEEEVQIYPRHSVLESEKSASNLEKGKETFEVGDTIVYTIKTRNKVSDSLVKNLTITDKLPAGLEYVADSLKVSHEGTGDFKDGTITANFGDVKDTEWRTVTFQAKIKSGQSGNTIENIAIVDGDNIDEPDEPSEKVTVDPKNPTLQSEKSAKLEAKAEGNKDKEHSEVGDTLRYTIKTQNTIEDSLVKNLVISDEIPEGLEYVADSLKVDGQSVTDAKDDDKGYAVDGKIVGQFGNIKDTNWHTVEFLVKVKSGQAGKDIKNIAVVDGDNIDKPDKPEEVVQVYPRHSVLESEKLAMNLEKGKDTFKVGDTVVYTIKARNTVSDSLVENLTITDKLPAGLEYVADSLEVSHEGTGEFKDGTITANFGDVKDTEWRTVTFKATIQSDQSGETIKNIATVSSDNVPDPNYPEAKIDVNPKDPAPKPEPKPNPDPGVDNSGGKTPPPKTEKEEGKKLPNTATNIFNYGLLGIVVVLVGLLALRRRKSSRD